MHESRGDVQPGVVRAAAVAPATEPGSGTGGLAGLVGSGGLTIEPDGSHRVWFEYDAPD